MASVSRFLTAKLRLKVNEAKSAVARPEEHRSSIAGVRPSVIAGPITTLSISAELDLVAGSRAGVVPVVTALVI